MSSLCALADRARPSGLFDDSETAVGSLSAADPSVPLAALNVSSVAILFGLSAVVLVGVAGYLLPRADEAVGGKWLLWLVTADAGWALVSLVREVVTSVEAMVVLAAIQLVVSVSTPVVWVVFAIVYTGRVEWLSKRTFAGLSLLPALTPLVYLTNPLHGLAFESIELVRVNGVQRVNYEIGEFVLAVYGYDYLLTIAGTVLIAVAAVTTRELYLDQTVAVLVGALVPVVGSVVVLVPPIVTAGTDLTVAFLSVRGVAFAYALSRGRLLESGPAIAHLGDREAVAALHDGLVIADADGVVVHANPAARSMLPAQQLVGRQLLQLLPGVTDLPDGTRREWRRPDGQRTYELSVEPITVEDGVRVGAVVTLRDVTERKRRRERVAVMNRVLRHNLRNDMNVVRGKARMLIDRLERVSTPAQPQTTQHGSTAEEPHREEDERTATDQGVDSEAVSEAVEELASIRRTADRLVRLGTKVRRFERAVSLEESADERTIDAERVLETVAARTRETHPNAVVTVESDGGHSIVTDPDVFESVLTELADNAARHNDRDRPRVEITFRVNPDGRHLVRVTDDGPGIPEADLAAVERRTETPVHHASRLGLWLVQWGVSRLGGELSFAERDPRGTVVTLQLPPASTATDSAPGRTETAEPDGGPTGDAPLVGESRPAHHDTRDTDTHHGPAEPRAGDTSPDDDGRQPSDADAVSPAGHEETDDDD